VQADFGGASGYTVYFHRLFRPPSWYRKTVESWGEVKSLPSVGERKKNWGRGRGKKNIPSPPPTPPTFCHSRPNSPSLQWIQNSGKPLDRPPKPPALQATSLLGHRLHCQTSLVASNSCYYSYQRFWLTNEANGSFPIVLTLKPRFRAVVNKRSFVCGLNCNNSYYSSRWSERDLDWEAQFPQTTRPSCFFLLDKEEVNVSFYWLNLSAYLTDFV